MNSKELYDYLPAEAGDELKRTEEQIRALMERINTIGDEQFTRVLSSEGLSQDDIMGISKELEHNPDPLLYFTNECFMMMTSAIRTAYTVPWVNEKSLSQLARESMENHDTSKNIQSLVNRNYIYKRLVMNEFFLWRAEQTQAALSKRINENSALTALLNHVKEPEHKKAVIRILAILFQLNKDEDYIQFLETAYHETIKQYVNEHSVKVSAGEWSITEMTKRITDNLLAERRNQEQWIYKVPIISVPMHGLYGITNGKYKHALSRYIKSEGVGLYSPDEKQDRIEVDLILILFTAVYSYLKPMYNREHVEESIPSKFCIGIEDISRYLYGSKRGLTGKFDEIIEKMRYTKYNTEGMVEEKNGPVSFKVIEQLEYNPYMNTVTFTSPLLSHIVTSMLTDGHNRAIRKMKEREDKDIKKAKKQNRDKVESKYYETDFPAHVVQLEKPSLVTQKDDNAKAVVRDILAWVKSANIFDEESVPITESQRQVETVPLVDGTTEIYITRGRQEKYSVSFHQVGGFSKGKNKGTKKNNEIYFSTLIERVPTLEQKINTVKNPTSILNETFTHVWMYMNKYTRFEETYPYVKIPGCNDIKEIDKMDRKSEEFKKWVPTLKNMHELKVVLDTVPVEQQIQEQIEQRKKK